MACVGFKYCYCPNILSSYTNCFLGSMTRIVFWSDWKYEQFKNGPPCLLILLFFLKIYLLDLLHFYAWIASRKARLVILDPDFDSTSSFFFLSCTLEAILPTSILATGKQLQLHQIIFFILIK